jgi:aspartyl-tRNA(Asn)/glutamyl-tRNA(Gln) amidotransferase subunit B
MPELPDAMRARFVRDYQLPEYDARLLTATIETGEYFERATKAAMDMTRVLVGMKGMEPVLAGTAKLMSNWIMGSLSAALNDAGIDIGQSPVSPAQLAKLVARLLDGTLNNRNAKDVFSAMWAGEHGGDADAIITGKGLKQMSDASELESICSDVIAANAQQVADYRAGKEKAFNSLVGQVMKLTRGKANPQQVNEILKRKIARS